MRDGNGLAEREASATWSTGVPRFRSGAALPASRSFEAWASRAFCAPRFAARARAISSHEAREALLVALEAADLALALRDLPGQPLHRRRPGRALLLEALRFAGLRGLVLGDGLPLLSRLRFERRDLLRPPLEFGERLGARALDIAEVGEVPRERGEVPAFEDEPQAILPAMLVLDAKEPLGERLLAGDLPAGAFAALAQLRELLRQGLPGVGQFEERAIGLAHGLLGGLEGLGRLAARFLGLRKLLFQALDPTAQLLEVLLGGGGRGGLLAGPGRPGGEAGRQHQAGDDGGRD